MKKLLLTSFITIAMLQVVISQDTLVISKSEFMDQVTKNNQQVKIAVKQAEMARAEYQQSNALYLPSVKASYSAITTTNPLMAFGSKLNQERITQDDFNPDLLNNPGNVENFAAEIQVLLPLLNLDGIYGRKAAMTRQEAYYLKAERTREYLEMEAAKQFMQLQLAYKAVEVLERAQHTSDQSVKLVSDYYELGMTQKADLLDAKVRATEVQNQLRFAKTHVINASDQLMILMGEQPDSVILKPATGPVNQYEQPEFSMDLPENRKDLLALSKSVEGYENMYKSSKMKFIPNINAFGSFQAYDNRFLTFDASGYLLGATLSWDLFDGYATIAKKNKARLEAEKANLEQTEYLSQQKAELTKTGRALEDAESKVKASQLAFDQAEEAYRIRRDRFEQGLEKTVDLLAAESQVYHKELELQQAIFEFNFTKEYLHFLTRE